jgi:hypothetical protein
MLKGILAHENALFFWPGRLNKKPGLMSCLPFSWDLPLAESQGALTVRLRKEGVCQSAPGREALPGSAVSA